jgi:hypothetical protein
VAHHGELLFLFVLQGQVGLRLRSSSEGRDGGLTLRVLHEADAVAIPAGRAFGLVDASDELELLEVSLPAELPVELVPVRPLDEQR